MDSFNYFCFIAAILLNTNKCNVHSKFVKLVTSESKKYIY